MARRATSLGPKPSLFCFFFAFFFLGGGGGCVFGGFKGQVRWPGGPLHSVLNPPCFALVFFLGGGGVGGIKGQVRWPKGATSLGPKPSLFIFFVFEEKLVFSLKVGHFCLLFSVSLCFSLAFCFTSLFLSLSSSFLSFFLSCLVSILLYFASLFLSLCFFVSFLCFCFINRTTSNIKFWSFFFHHSFLFCGFLSGFVFQIPFACLCYSYCKIVFFVQHQCSFFEKRQEKHQFLVKRGVATKRFFLITCVC